MMDMIDVIWRSKRQICACVRARVCVK